MAGNTIGKLFTLTTYGESHGPVIGAVIDGCPPGLLLDREDIQKELNRRRPGKTKHTSARDEADQIQILSGVFEGVTTGTPIGLQIQNQDPKPQDYQKNRDVYRPGHADYTYQQKYGIRDYRGGGRASARETAMRVAAGAIAKKYLAQRYQVSIQAYLAQVGELILPCKDLSYANDNPYFIADPSKLAELKTYLQHIEESRDSIGARINVIASHLPVGLGEPVYDRLDAEIARAMMSINASKGVEIGDGFSCIEQLGSEHRDEIGKAGYHSNHAGGIVGGISNGQDIYASVAFKPASSIAKPAHTIDSHGNETVISTQGRHDPCVGIRAVPIVEAMLAIVLMDHVLRHRAQNADNLFDIPAPSCHSGEGRNP